MGHAGKVARLLLFSSIFPKPNDYFFLAFLEGMYEQALVLTNEIVRKSATIAGQVLHALSAQVSDIENITQGNSLNVT